EGEKRLLLAANVGEGLFFAGQNHVAIRVIASPDEHRLITTNPQEVLKRRQVNQADQINNAIEKNYGNLSAPTPPQRVNSNGDLPPIPKSTNNQTPQISDLL